MRQRLLAMLLVALALPTATVTVPGSAAAAPPSPTAARAAAAAANPYGDSNLVSMFDGRTLTDWTASDAGGYDVKDGAIHTTGHSRGYLYYNRQQVGTFRWIFTVRQVVGTNHEPTVLFWGTTNPVRDALSSIQFQPPDGYVWDYRPGHNNDAKAFVKHYSHPKPSLTPWNQCEIIGNQSTGVAQMACCPATATGKACVATQVVRFTDPTAARVGPLAIQTHNAGIQDEYRGLYLESPVRTKPDQFLTTSVITG